MKLSDMKETKYIIIVVIVVVIVNVFVIVIFIIVVVGLSCVWPMSPWLSGRWADLYFPWCLCC